jgi:hypothetical protein
LPPVDVFWSVTAYDAEGYFIPNPLSPQAIGDRDKLVLNPDGSLDLYLQAESTGRRTGCRSPRRRSASCFVFICPGAKSSMAHGPPPVKRAN